MSFHGSIFGSTLTRTPRKPTLEVGFVIADPGRFLSPDFSNTVEFIKVGVTILRRLPTVAEADEVGAEAASQSAERLELSSRAPGHASEKGKNCIHSSFEEVGPVIPTYLRSGITIIPWISPLTSSSRCTYMSAYKVRNSINNRPTLGH